MGSISDKLDYLNQTKIAIAQAIKSKGVYVSNSDTFDSYAAKIRSLNTIPRFKEKNISQNGSYQASNEGDDCNGYDIVRVKVGINEYGYYKLDGCLIDGIAFNQYINNISKGLTGALIFTNDPQYAPGSKVQVIDVSVASDKSIVLFRSDNANYQFIVYTEQKGILFPPDSSFMLSDLSGLTKVVFDTAANTDNVLNMSGMFNNCPNLKEILFGKYFNTVRSTNLSKLFSGCTSLQSLNLRTFNTGNTIDMTKMFENCKSLKTIYVDGTFFTVDQVTGSENMFNGCISLVGGQKTAYDATHVDKTYACVDGGTTKPGYFTEAVKPKG